MPSERAPTYELVLPATGGPWSYRSFADRRAAQAFFDRLEPGHDPPFLLRCDHRAPEGRVLRAGTWIVFYRPIIMGD